jgi:mono/diheme cytochrome c family protein
MAMGTNQIDSRSRASSSQSGDPYKLGALVFVSMLGVAPIILVAVSWFGSTYASVQSDAEFHDVSSSWSAQLITGESVYKDTCMVCHGDNGQGVAQLGKPLRNSAYVQDASDQDLFDLIAMGRLPDDDANTSGTLMPARGAKNMDDAQITKVVAHLRDMQDLSQPTVSVADWDFKLNAAASDQVAGDGVEVPGQALFFSSCSSCHGASGEGIEGLGKPFTTSAFVAESTDKELKTMIMMGRPIWDAANTTGIDMPPKGGNPAISSEQLDEIIQYIRSVSTVEN